MLVKVCKQDPIVAALYQGAVRVLRGITDLIRDMEISRKNSVRPQDGQS